MRQQNIGETAEAGAGAQQLALRPLAAIDQEALAAGAHQQGRQAALGRGRGRRRAEKSQLEHAALTPERCDPARLPISRRGRSGREQRDFIGPRQPGFAACRHHRRADRERQVGAGARTGGGCSAARSSTPTPADLPRPADPDAPGPRRRRWRGCRTGSMAISMPPSAARPDGGASSRLARSPRSHRAGRLPIVVGGTGLYLRALQRGARRDPADPAGGPRRSRRICTGSLAATTFRAAPGDSSIRKRRRCCPPATGSG